MGEVRELARQALADYSFGASPATAALKRTLDGPLGMSKIEAAQRADTQAFHNYQLVSEFAGLLPRAEWTDREWVFTTKQPSQAKLLQATTMWREHKILSHSSATEDLRTHYPFYVVGRQHGKTEPQSLLLAAAHIMGVSFDDYYSIDPSRVKRDTLNDAPKQGERMFRRTLTSGQLKTYEKQIQWQLGEPYTAEEARRYEPPASLYNRRTGEFKVHGGSPGSISASMPFESSNSFLWNLMHGSAIQDANSRPLSAYERRLPMQDFIGFDVLSKMGQLATMFDVVSETDDLLAKSPALSTDDL